MAVVAPSDERGPHGSSNAPPPCRSRGRLTQGGAFPGAAGPLHQPRGSGRARLSHWSFPDRSPLFRLWPGALRALSRHPGMEDRAALQRTSTFFTSCSTIGRRTFRRPGGSNPALFTWNTPCPDTSSLIGIHPVADGRPQFWVRLTACACWRSFPWRRVSNCEQKGPSAWTRPPP